MIVLNVTYHTKPGKRAAFYEAINAECLAQASRAEAGNGKYAYFAALENENVLFLLENWADQAAFDAHMATPHFKRLGELKSEYVAETKIEKYTV